MEETKSRKDVMFDCIMSSLKEQEEITSKLYSKINFVLDPICSKTAEDNKKGLELASEEADLLTTLSIIRNKLVEHNNNLLDIINRCVL